MRRRLTDIGSLSIGSLNIRSWTWLSIVAALVVTGLGLTVAAAQTSPPPQIVRPAANQTAVVTSGAGQYYFEFRSRYAWDYGHTFVVFGRVGERPNRNNVAGAFAEGR